MKSFKFKSNNYIQWFTRVIAFIIFISILSIACFYIYQTNIKIKPQFIINKIKQKILKEKNVKQLSKDDFKKITQKQLIIYQLYIQHNNNNNNLFNK